MTEHEQKKRRTELAFVRVFGLEGQRTEEQQHVWDVLKRESFFTVTSLWPKPDGHSDPLALAFNEGRRQQWLNIYNRVEAGSADEDTLAAPKPTVKR